MREPTIHIDRKIFEGLVEDYCIRHKLEIDVKQFTKWMFSKGKSYSKINRTIQITNDRLEKKAKKLISSSTGDANLFARLLHTIRVSLKHRGVRQIKPNTKDWATIKELSSLAIDFCNEFGLSKEIGFKQYILIGIKRSNKFILNKLLGMYDLIANHYGAIKELEQDENKTLTSEIYKYYNKIITDKTGIPMDFSDTPEKYVYFYRIQKECLELKVDYWVYIKAQFAALDFVNGIPEPQNMVGNKSRQRLSKYLYENNIQTNSAKENLQEIRNRILNGND